jgi:riboflavin biosynthesis pyrimidine reductase
MVEGGARIIDSFLSHADFVDKIVVTIAPIVVGSLGVGYDGAARVRRLTISMRITSHARIDASNETF